MLGEDMSTNRPIYRYIIYILFIYIRDLVNVVRDLQQNGSRSSGMRL